MMKKYILSIIVLTLLLNCKGDEENNNSYLQRYVRFALHLPPITLANFDSNHQRGNGSTDVPKRIEFTIFSSEGKKVYFHKSLPLSVDADGQFFSEYFALTAGEFEIIEFWVKDQRDKVIYKCPDMMSSMATYVQHPLPFNFSVAKNSTQTITLEVLPYDESMLPKTFGYPQLSVKYPFSFSLLVIDEITKKTLPAHVKITHFKTTRVLYDKDIQEGVQLIVIKNMDEFDESDEFELIISKQNYQNKTYVHKKKELYDFRYPKVMVAAIHKNIYQGSFIAKEKSDLEQFLKDKYSIVTGDVIIRRVNNIENLRYLKYLELIEGGLVISDNSSLQSLEGLENLISIKGKITPETNVKCGLFIKNNASLNNIKGLQSLTSIKNGLLIEGNDALNNIKGLEKLNEIGVGSKRIRILFFSTEEFKFNIWISIPEKIFPEIPYSFLCPLKYYLDTQPFENVIIVKGEKPKSEDEYKQYHKTTLFDRYLKNCDYN